MPDNVVGSMPRSFQFFGLAIFPYFSGVQLENARHYESPIARPTIARHSLEKDRQGLKTAVACCPLHPFTAKNERELTIINQLLKWPSLFVARLFAWRHHSLPGIWVIHRFSFVPDQSGSLAGDDGDFVQSRCATFAVSVVLQHVRTTFIILHLHSSFMVA